VRSSWLSYIGLYVAGIALFSVLTLAGYPGSGILALCLMMGISGILRFRYLFTCTEERIITQVGLIARDTSEMRLRHIRTINVRQGIIERILGIGTVVFSSVADGEGAVIFKEIGDPQGVKER